MSYKDYLEWLQMVENDINRAKEETAHRMEASAYFVIIAVVGMALGYIVGRMLW